MDPNQLPSKWPTLSNSAFEMSSERLISEKLAEPFLRTVRGHVSYFFIKWRVLNEERVFSIGQNHFIPPTVKPNQSLWLCCQLIDFLSTSTDIVTVDRRPAERCAVCLELCESLDVDSFWNSLRRFVARRGKLVIVSATTAGEACLETGGSNWNQRKKKNFLRLPTKHRMELFPTERQRVLSVVLEKRSVDEGMFRIVLCDIELLMNGRPF